ncbi:hypothetical protein H0H92_011195, partial [Tricholoma furcatifolium]
MELSLQVLSMADSIILWSGEKSFFYGGVNPWAPKIWGSWPEAEAEVAAEAKEEAEAKAKAEAEAVELKFKANLKPATLAWGSKP